MSEHWIESTLGEIYDVRDGTHDSPKYQEKGYALITSKNLKNGNITYDKVKYISEDDYLNINKRSGVSIGDILFAMIGTIGNPVVVRNEPDFSIKNVALFKVPDEQDSFFLKYYLESSYVKEKMQKEAKGTTQKFVGLGYLRNFPIRLPALPEQKRIVAILDEVFVGIDTAIANTEKNLANTRELFGSYLRLVFSERDEKWEDKNLGEVCDNLDSKRIPITKSKRKSGEIPYYGASGVVDHVADFIFDEDLLLVSEDGANLLARTYPIAFSISGKTWVNNHAHVLRFEKMDSQRFIEYYLNSISLAPYVSGMAQPKLNQKSLNSIPVPFPAIKIQSEIVEKLDSLSLEIQRIENIYKQKLASLSELKQSLLQKAFSGELTAEDDKLKEEAVA